MMGVILLTVELIGLGSTASTYPPPGHLTMIMEGAYRTVRHSREAQHAHAYTNASAGN